MMFSKTVTNVEFPKTWEKFGKTKVDLTVGKPDFHVPENVKSKAIAAIKEDKNGYAHPQGLPELRQKIAEKLGNISAENIIITAGSSVGYAIALDVLINPRDEVIVLEPYYPPIKEVCKIKNITTNIVATLPSGRIDFDNLLKSVTESTQVIVINSPNNPTGCVYSKEELLKLAKFAREKEIWIISDEVYTDFTYEGQNVDLSLYYDKVVRIRSISKSYGATGWRVGYCTGPMNYIQEALKVGLYTTICAPVPFQHAAIEALDTDMSSIVEEYNRRRKYVCGELIKWGYEFTEPLGGFFVFVKYPYDAKSFLWNCQQKGLAVAPGSDFQEVETHFRISFAVDWNTLTKAIEILSEVKK